MVVHVKSRIKTLQKQVDYHHHWVTKKTKSAKYSGAGIEIFFGIFPFYSQTMTALSIQSLMY